MNVISMKACVSVYMRMVLPGQYVIGGIFAQAGLAGQLIEQKA